MQWFPGETVIRQLKRDMVQYVIMHAAAYKPAALNNSETTSIQDGHLLEMGIFDAPDGPAVLYRMR